LIGHPVVIDLLNLLNNRRIQYMISGSVASMYYGEPRLTHDIDLVVDIKLEKALGLVDLLGENYYISDEGIKNALIHQTMFNIIHNDTGLKIDFWILTDSEFDVSRFERRVVHIIEGTKYFFSSLEDTILVKLIWLKESGHSKHGDDINSMIELNNDKLDRNYLNKWILFLDLGTQAKQLGIEI
jgi:hypothetical protein